MLRSLVVLSFGTSCKSTLTAIVVLTLIFSFSKNCRTYLVLVKGFDDFRFPAGRDGPICIRDEETLHLQSEFIFYKVLHYIEFQEGNILDSRFLHACKGQKTYIRYRQARRSSIECFLLPIPLMPPVENWMRSHHAGLESPTPSLRESQKHL